MSALPGLCTWTETLSAAGEEGELLQVGPLGHKMERQPEQDLIKGATRERLHSTVSSGPLGGGFHIVGSSHRVLEVSFLIQNLQLNAVPTHQLQLSRSPTAPGSSSLCSHFLSTAWWGHAVWGSPSLPKSDTALRPPQ